MFLKDCEKIATCLQYFGLIVFSYLAIKYTLKIWNNLSTFYLGAGSVDFKKHGSWAVVTGCTDGIGKAYAELLAKRGLNIVLISRTLAKLEKLSAELVQEYGIKTKVIAVDFTDPCPLNSIYPLIRKELSDPNLDIGLLVNNVGMAQSEPSYFHLLGQNSNINTEIIINNLVNCNIMTVVKMTDIVLPGMLERKRGGVIINNASSTGRIVTPLMTLYSSTKAFVDFFTRGLSVEYKSQGIIFQSLCPFFVATKLADVHRSFVAPDPITYVEAALKSITTQPISNGCLIHNIQGWFMEDILPEDFTSKITFKELSIYMDKLIAKRAKKAQETPEQKEEKQE